MHKRASDSDGMCCVCVVLHAYIHIYIRVSHCIMVVKVATNGSDVMKVMLPHCHVGVSTTRYICSTPQCTHDVWYTPIIVASLGFPQFMNGLTCGVYDVVPVSLVTSHT